MTYHEDLQCPKCGNRHLRREFAPGPSWTSYKCLDSPCFATFAMYEAPTENSTAFHVETKLVA